MITTLLARIRKLTVTEEKRLLVLCCRRGDPTVFVSRILKGLEFKYPSLDVNQQVINHHTISICYNLVCIFIFPVLECKYKYTI